MSYLEVNDLRVSFRGDEVVSGVSFAVAETANLGIIGQSGSGKSLTALAVMGLLPESATVTGSIRLAGRELIGLPERELRQIRGDELSMVFQEPMTALDPTMRVGKQVGEVVALHHRELRGDIHNQVLAWLARVGLEQPQRLADSYPHELSGGQRQRVLIAMALANQPGLVICDEPTTALDVLVQRQILNLLREELIDRASLFISHDLAVVREVCDHVLVLKDGALIESGPVEDVIAQPQHDYTRGLIEAARIRSVPFEEDLVTMSERQAKR
ncbi:MAG: ABC transporter ATP-binding protein [Arachnia propionica]|nr:MAG: ABC transporter ATP-binding protein [Arachnia propionica]